MKQTSTTSRGGIPHVAPARSAFQAHCAPLLIAVVVMLLAACSDTADDPEGTSEDRASPAVASPSPTPPPTQVEVESWAGDELPTIAGKMARQGDLGIYFAEVDHQYTLVAIDITTGAERWRQPVHQHGRVAGTVQTPTVDWDGGLVFATVYDYDEQRRGIAAFDVGDGEVQWGNNVGWARSTPELCVDDLICVSLADGGRETFDRDTGALSTLTTGGLERVIGLVDSLLIRADADDRLAALQRTNPDGTPEQLWQRSFAELFGDEQAAATYSPNGGWSTHHDDSTGSTAVAFYAFTAEEVDDEVRREEAKLGWAVSLVGDDGEVRGSWQQVDLCLPSGAWRDGTIVLCEDLELLDSRIVDGEAQPFGHGTRVSGYRTADGEQRWTTALPAPVESAAPTSDGSLFVLRLADADALVLDVDDGSTVPLSETSELILACEPEYEHEDLFGTLLTSDRDQIDYRRALAEDVFQPCDASGNLIDPSAILETGELTPDWFGYRPRLEDDEEPEGADRWAVWVTTDGTLQGAGPAPTPGG